MPANDVLVRYVGEKKPHYIDFTNILDDTQTLVGTPSISSSDVGLTLTNIITNNDKKVQVWIEATEEARGKRFKLNVSVVANDGSEHNDFVRLNVPS